MKIAVVDDSKFTRMVIKQILNDLFNADFCWEAENGKVVIAVMDNELTVKRYKTNGKKIVLEPENPKYKPITVEKESEGYIWGVVTNVIHNL